ncbi:hypothetical protein A0H81_03957 [Grifola frondosa]|uniref:Uncharacterized protein n=1 Tax=Grifola frondosa TaxID=5627 RepID=A0A1C7MJ21_GRIFR|nr:hypothetical protein A0H81_03957 [Grifola frondosa]
MSTSLAEHSFLFASLDSKQATTARKSMGNPCSMQGKDIAEPDAQRVKFLTAMMRQHPDERESILKELILRLINSELYRQAMEELELYLPSFPYQDNPVFHLYAGLISLYLAQPSSNLFLGEEFTNGSDWDANLVRDAQGRFERAKALDPTNVVAIAFLDQLPDITRATRDRNTQDSDDESTMHIDRTSRRKRIKT